MKCANCGHDSRRPERSDGCCPRCRTRFVFDVGEGDPLSDHAWLRTIAKVSSEGTVRFTRANLYEAVARRLARKGPSPLVTFLILAIPLGVVPSVLFVILDSLWPLLIGLPLLALGLLGAVSLHRDGAACPLKRAAFGALLKRWEQAHGELPGLIRPASRPRDLSPELAQELGHYSFDRVVVCDDPETVDLLLGNDFHFENNCAVLTVDGYPDHAAPTVARMLKTNPRLEVFALHDATPGGCTLAHVLRTSPEWFPDPSVRIYDVAIRPAQAKRMRHLSWKHAAPMRVKEHPALSADERAWLATHEMRVAALPPEQIIKRLYRAMQQLPELAAQAGGGDGSVFIWTTDASASDGGGDSFG